MAISSFKSFIRASTELYCGILPSLQIWVPQNSKNRVVGVNKSTGSISTRHRELKLSRPDCCEYCNTPNPFRNLVACQHTARSEICPEEAQCDWDKWQLQVILL
ncbi:hypothetical protein Y1Q_0015680 [Alligator mississippiensis]|uniref:Uncharacterized protein n=1 Tax=Alligator mississippiensis TaxID=8496 RepID=A0A151NNM5_ALLMI|nr:hypothetical protein Y1Q_0015680 [Alligator mississippiensis]